MCLLLVSVEDVADVYIIAIVVNGFVLFGMGGFLLYRKLQNVSAAINN